MNNMISVTCPRCGARVSVENSHKQYFCVYCGTKINVNIEASSHTYRKIDEARIMEAELNAAVRFKELDMEEKRRADETKKTKVKAIISIVLGIIGVLLCMFSGDNEMVGVMGLAAFAAILWIWIGGAVFKG